MSQISAATSVDNAVRASNNRFSEMSTEEFIDVIFTELTNQDPLQPNDTSALLDQLNSIRSIESDIALTDKLESLVTENQLSAASSMIGKFVGGLSQDLERVSGYVLSAVRQGDSIALELDGGWMVPIEQVETVIDPSIFEEPPGAGDGSGGDDDADEDESESDDGSGAG